MKISSSAFGEGGVLPADFGARGGDKKPPIRIEDVPNSAKSLALIFYDIDSPGGSRVHWVVWDIPPDAKTVTGIEGTNGLGGSGYSGPNPSADDGVHKYMFKAFALNKVLNLQKTAGKSELESAMSGRILAEAQLIVRYGMPKPLFKKKEKKNVNW
jgi:hypothetical protein